LEERLYELASRQSNLISVDSSDSKIDIINVWMQHIGIYIYILGTHILK